MNIKMPELPFDISSFGGKNLLISVAVVYTIGLCAFLVNGALKVASPITSYGSLTTIDQPETGINTSCDTNEDCWCRNFDGSRFVEGKAPAQCVRSTKHCQKCVYR